MNLTAAQKMYIAGLWNRQEAFEYLTSECEVGENEANEFCQNVETEIKRALRFRNPRKKCTTCNGKGTL